MIGALRWSCGRVEVPQMKKRSLRGLVPAALTLGLLLASPVLANDQHHHGKGRGHHTDNRGNSDHPAYGHVPELDPGLIGSAAVLLIGGTLVLHGRRRIEVKA